MQTDSTTNTPTDPVEIEDKYDDKNDAELADLCVDIREETFQQWYGHLRKLVAKLEPGSQYSEVVNLLSNETYIVRTSPNLDGYWVTAVLGCSREGCFLDQVCIWYITKNFRDACEIHSIVTKVVTMYHEKLWDLSLPRGKNNDYFDQEYSGFLDEDSLKSCPSLIGRYPYKPEWW